MKPTSESAMVGGSEPSGPGGHPPGVHDSGHGCKPDYDGVIKFLDRNAPSGVIINKILVWMDLQLGTTGKELLINQAKARFTHNEIVQAKTLLFDCADNNVIGQITIRNRVNKELLTLKDLVEAMEKLNEAEKMPLLMSSSQMMRDTPVYNTVTSDVGNEDIIQRVKVLESGLEGFMKNQNEKMTRLTELVGSIGQGQSTQTPAVGIHAALSHPVRVRQVSVSGAGHRERLESVTKKRKVDEDQDEEVHNDGGETWTDVVKKNTKTVVDVKTGVKQKGAWRKQKHAFGTAKSVDEDQIEVKAADVALVISGVSKNVTADQLKEFVTKKGLVIKTCALLTNVERNPEARSHTFKVTIDSEDYEKSKDGTYWPYRVYVRMFKNFRDTKNDIQNQQMEEVLGQHQPRHG